MPSASAVFIPTVTSINCPACGKVGNSPRPIPVGTKVRCKCGHSFVAALDDEDYSPIIAPTPSVAPIPPDDDVSPLPDDDDIPITVTVINGKRGPGPEPWYYDHLETDGKSIASYADMLMWVAFFGYLAVALLSIFFTVERNIGSSTTSYAVVGFVILAIPYVLIVLAIRWGIRSIAAGILLSVDHARNARASRWNTEPV